MKGECPQCHRGPDFTNVGTCPNCGRFEWVLASVSTEDGAVSVPGVLWASGPVSPRLLWACPCGEFQWTSYAEWEGCETATPEHPDRAPTSGTL